MSSIDHAISGFQAVECATRCQPDHLPWYAVQVQSRLTSLAFDTLCGKGYETYLPLYRSERRWSDRVKKLDLPLFPGYLFSRFDVLHRLPVLTTPGAVSYTHLDVYKRQGQHRPRSGRVHCRALPLRQSLSLPPRCGRPSPVRHADAAPGPGCRSGRRRRQGRRLLAGRFHRRRSWKFQLRSKSATPRVSMPMRCSIVLYCLPRGGLTGARSGPRHSLRDCLSLK